MINNLHTITMMASLNNMRHNSNTDKIVKNKNEDYNDGNDSMVLGIYIRNIEHYRPISR